jgi:hypothetical protein
LAAPSMILCFALAYCYDKLLMGSGTSKAQTRQIQPQRLSAGSRNRDLIRWRFGNALYCFRPMTAEPGSVFLDRSESGWKSLRFIILLMIAYLVASSVHLALNVRSAEGAATLVSSDSGHYLDFAHRFAVGNFTMDYIREVPHRHNFLALATVDGCARCACRLRLRLFRFLMPLPPTRRGSGQRNFSPAFGC